MIVLTRFVLGPKIAILSRKTQLWALALLQVILLMYCLIKNVLVYVISMLLYLILLFYGEQKQDELLLEDVWTLLKAGRLEEACELCSSAGQACFILYYFSFL